MARQNFATIEAMVQFFEEIKVLSTVVHVAGVVIGMGSALLSDVLFSFYGKDKKLNKTELSTLEILSRIVIYGLIIISVSGIFIFLSDTEKYMNSSKFLAKMSILAVLLLNGYFLNKFIWPHLLGKNFFTSKKERGARRYAFASGAVSVISWLSVCALGVIDALNMSYIVIMSLYGLVVALGVMIAIFIEKIELD